MARPPFDLDEQFEEWLNGHQDFSLRSEYLHNDLDNCSDKMAVVLKWLRAAYKQGARDLANDTVYTLGCYATALSGLDDKCYTRSSAYDAAQESIEHYYKGILENE